MTILQAIVLGIIQGLTEFLPVSSSGHLIFVPHIFGWTDQGMAFDVVMHLGTLIAVIIYFRKKLWQILSSFFQRGAKSKLNQRLGLLLVFSIIPAGLVGLLGAEWIEHNIRSTYVVAAGLIGWGLVLFVADQMNKRWTKKGERLSDLNHLSWKQIAFVACAQAVALIPGTSRSGITMTAGLFAKLDKKAAAEFSFLMSVPIIAIAGFMGIMDMTSASESIAFVPLIAGFIASVVSGFMAIWGLMKIIQRWSFTSFVVYRIVVGILILLFLV